MPIPTVGNSSAYISGVAVEIGMACGGSPNASLASIVLESPPEKATEQPICVVENPPIGVPPFSGLSSEHSTILRTNELR